MKKHIITIFTALLFMNNMQAQNSAENFLQPYSLGVQRNSEHFSGDVWVSKIVENDSLSVPTYNVTFAPSCINSWHYHTGGQILIATAGTGYYQERGKPARILHKGDIVEISPNVEHWHGAAPNSWFAHIAILSNASYNKTVWQEPVGKTAYTQAVEESVKHLKAVTQNLSEREKAIINLGSYIGNGNLDGVKQSVEQGLNIGMTQNELKEVIVHAYAYCGFPRALRALQVMMEVVNDRKERGINDLVGREASAIKSKKSRYERGKTTLSKLTGTPLNAPKTPYAVFAPIIDEFLAEHLFADIFDRDVLNYTERELATVSILCGVGGVEPMLQSHLGITLRLGVTKKQLNELVSIIDFNLGRTYSNAVKELIGKL